MWVELEFYTKRPNLELRNVRIKIPKEIYAKIKNKFVLIQVNGFTFKYKVSKENRFVIYKKNLQKINFKNKNIIKIKILQKINVKSSKSIIQNNKINVEPLIPNKTNKGFSIKRLVSKNKIDCFYNSYSGINEVKINKSTPLEFTRFLGYYQAEGGKPKNKYHVSEQISFTNTKLSIIWDFINLSKSFINPQLWSAEIKVLKRKKIKERKLKKFLINLNINKEKIKIRTEKNLRDFSIRLSICSNILYEILFNILSKIKIFLIKEDLKDKKIKKMYINFMQGLFAGDGNFNKYKEKNGGTHFRLEFYEEKENYAREINQLLNKIIKNKIIKKNGKNMYLIRSTLNWKKLLLLEKLKLFDFHPKHKNSLKEAIKNHDRYKSHKNLIGLKNRFNIMDLINNNEKSKIYNYNWVKNMIRYNLIKKNGKNDWSLTNEGIQIKKILNELSCNF